jgi:(2R)-3-sulfolactate dehydrogenase (NADP+)
MANKTLSLDQVHQLAATALLGAGAGEAAAHSVARSTVAAERDGIRSHGLLYVPIYAEHVACGKVNGAAVPTMERPRPGAIRVNAHSGFAHPAIDVAADELASAARQNGVAILTLHNSYNCGVLGHHAERLSNNGLLTLCFTHAPASIAPAGGRSPVIGTNPFAVGVPDGKGGVAFVIDQSASVVAKSEILLRARTGEPIEPGWALDAEGNPATDPQKALAGSMLPAGGYKGFGVGMMVELLAACLAGAVLSKDASPFSGTVGGPPNTGQCFIAIDPEAMSGSVFANKVEEFVQAIVGQPGARLPGARRMENRQRIDRDGVSVPEELIDRIEEFHA